MFGARIFEFRGKTRHFATVCPEVALFRRHDPSAAITSAARAAKLGRELGDEGVEFTALGLEGLACVSAGDVERGMRRLDEASVATTAGEVRELHAVGLVSCRQIFACEHVRDYDRAAQWCARVQEFSRRWGLRPLSAICRTQYAGVLIWHGDWTEAEAELATATQELQQARPALTSPPVARLGDLDAADVAFRELERIASAATTTSCAASVRAADAGLLRERGDIANAVTRLENAAELFQQTGAPFWTARARLDLADALAAFGRTESAEREARLAMESLDALGAEHEANRGRHLLRTLGGAKAKASRATALTEQGREVQDDGAARRWIRRGGCGTAPLRDREGPHDRTGEPRWTVWAHLREPSRRSDQESGGTEVVMPTERSDSTRRSAATLLSSRRSVATEGSPRPIAVSPRAGDSSLRSE